MGQSSALTNAQIARAALLVLLGFLASGVMGFIRTAVLAGQFGTSEAHDAFIAAQRIPEVIFVLVAGGALGSSFIPIFAQQRESATEQAWRLASAVMTLAASAAALLGLLVFVFADLLVSQILLPGRSLEAQALTASMTRMMMVTPFIFSISGLVMGILQTHGLFLLPSVAISMNSLGIIFGALVLAPLMASVPFSSVELALSIDGLAQSNQYSLLPIDQVGNSSVYGLAYGAILSALLHLAVQIPGLIGIRARLRPLFDWRVPGVLPVLRLMGPRILGLAVVQINFIVNIILTSSMVEGSLAALNIAFQLMFTSLGVIGQSVGSAVFPTLAALFAANNVDGFKDRLATALRSVLFLSFPATVAFIVFGESIVSIFERGEWTAESTRATAWALGFYATGIAGFALLEVLSRAFYALADTWTPVLVGIGAMISNIVLSLIFVQIIGDPQDLTRGPFAGLALANALTTLVEAIILWALMRRRLGLLSGSTDLNDAYVFSGAGRSALAAVGMGALLMLLPQIIVLQGLPYVMLGVIAGAGCFFALSILLGLDEARAVPRLILRRLRR